MYTQIQTNKQLITKLYLLQIITAVFFVQSKRVAKENEKLATQVQEMEESIIELESKLEAAEQNKYDRIETKTVQIMKDQVQELVRKIFLGHFLVPFGFFREFQVQFHSASHDRQDYCATLKESLHVPW